MGERAPKVIYKSYKWHQSSLDRMEKIRVGCCGWPCARDVYFKHFKTVELQSTFYKLPKLETAIRWREQATNNFCFSLKAWQAITHLPTSPTWRRAGLKPTKEHLNKYGWLRPTKENFEAWRLTKNICDALEAKVCVIQCPPNFKCTAENIANMREFLSKIDRGKLALAWEPRGDWNEHPDEIAELCEELELTHVVDLMRREPVSEQPIAYIRLHGLNPKEYDYRYNYSEGELRLLAKKARSLAEVHDEVYIMFNNTEMYANALHLMKILKVKGGSR